MLTARDGCSLAIGFILSILGSALLFLGQLGSFAGVFLLPFPPPHLSVVLLTEPWVHNEVLYAMGTVISLIGTGFLLGVSVPPPLCCCSISDVRLVLV